MMAGKAFNAAVVVYLEFLWNDENGIFECCVNKQLLTGRLSQSMDVLVNPLELSSNRLILSKYWRYCRGTPR